MNDHHNCTLLTEKSHKPEQGSTLAGKATDKKTVEMNSTNSTQCSALIKKHDGDVETSLCGAQTNDENGRKEEEIEPHQYDVICGQGISSSLHVGNRRFRLLGVMVLSSGNEDDLDIPTAARHLIEKLSRCDPPGRFLGKRDGKWTLVPDKLVQKITEKCLTEIGGEIKCFDGLENNTPSPDIRARPEGTIDNHRKESSNNQGDSRHSLLGDASNKAKASSVADASDSQNKTSKPPADTQNSTNTTTKKSESSSTKFTPKKSSMGPPDANREFYTNNDVLCGPIPVNSVGNRRFQVMVDLHRRRFEAAANKEDKRLVAASIVYSIEGCNPPGRFLEACLKTHIYIEVSSERALDLTELYLSAPRIDVPPRLSNVDVAHSSSKPTLASSQKPSSKASAKASSISPPKLANGMPDMLRPVIPGAPVPASGRIDLTEAGTMNSVSPAKSRNQAPQTQARYQAPSDVPQLPQGSPSGKPSLPDGIVWQLRFQKLNDSRLTMADAIALQHSIFSALVSEDGIETVDEGGNRSNSVTCLLRGFSKPQASPESSITSTTSKQERIFLEPQSRPSRVQTSRPSSTGPAADGSAERFSAHQRQEQGPASFLPRSSPGPESRVAARAALSSRETIPASRNIAGIENTTVDQDTLSKLDKRTQAYLREMGYTSCHPMGFKEPDPKARASDEHASDTEDDDKFARRQQARARRLLRKKQLAAEERPCFVQTLGEGDAEDYSRHGANSGAGMQTTAVGVFKDKRANTYSPHESIARRISVLNKDGTIECSTGMSSEDRVSRQTASRVPLQSVKLAAEYIANQADRKTELSHQDPPEVLDERAAAKTPRRVSIWDRGTGSRVHGNIYAGDNDSEMVPKGSRRVSQYNMFSATSFRSKRRKRNHDVEADSVKSMDVDLCMDTTEGNSDADALISSVQTSSGDEDGVGEMKEEIATEEEAQDAQKSTIEAEAERAAAEAMLAVATNK